MNDSQNSSCVATFSFQDREVSLFVAPWLQDKNLSETTAGEVTRFVLKSLPGLSSVILTLNLNDLYEVPYIIQYYEAVFGKGILDYSILAFISDSEHENTIRLEHAFKELRHIIKEYKYRVFINLEGKQDNEKKTKQIIKYTDAIMKNNDGTYFRNDTFDKVEELVKGVGVQKRRRLRCRVRGTDANTRLLLQIRREQLCIKRMILKNKKKKVYYALANGLIHYGLYYFKPM